MTIFFFSQLHTCSLKFRIWETMQAIVTKMQLENAGLLQFSGNVGHFNPVTNHQPIFRSCKKNKRIEKRSSSRDLVARARTQEQKSPFFAFTLRLK